MILEGSDPDFNTVLMRSPYVFGIFPVLFSHFLTEIHDFDRFEFWRSGVSVDNRRFCPIFVAKSAPKGSCRKPLFCSLFAPKLSHFYSKIFGYRCIFMCWRNFVCPSNRRFEANCQRGTVSTLEFRFEAKLSTWISTLESFCRKLFFLFAFVCENGRFSL